MIQIEFLQICERIEELNGSANILGLTDTFRSSTYPFIKSFAFICRFRLPAKSHVTGKLGFELFDSDDQRIWYQNGTVDMFYEPSREEPDTIASNMTGSFENFPFTKAGVYQLRAVWNGEVVAVAPLFAFYPIPPGETPGRGEVVAGG